MAWLVDNTASQEILSLNEQPLGSTIPETVSLNVSCVAYSDRPAPAMEKNIAMNNIIFFILFFELIEEESTIIAIKN